MKKNNFLSFFIIFFYIVTRIIYDSFWARYSPYYSYIFEFAFVLSVFSFYKEKVSFKIKLSQIVIPSLVATISGFAIYKAASPLNITIPFNLKETETILLLLLLAPTLEELIFRMALWEPLEQLLKNKHAVLVVTTFLFSVGHFTAYWKVPVEYKTFVLYQTTYVVLLGLAAGFGKIKSKSVFNPIAIRFGFNLGFFIASL